VSRVIVSSLAAACIFPCVGIGGLWVVAAAEERVVVAETAGDWGVRVESRHAGQTKAGTFVVAPPDGVESVFPPRPKDQPPQARARLPETLRRLEAGEKLKILAWGDSVTTYDRWQSMFVERLKARYPQADIELVTEAWGGRNTGSYLAEPPGSEHNYREKVLESRPHLIVSEFVNDAGMTPADVDRQYGQLLADFRGIGAEWIILTPHYVMPEWMGPGFLERGQRDIDDDPRPYVAGLKAFVATHPERVALADAARRYGRLWRQGIPYLTLMENNINHPNVAGHRIFADALDEVFSGPAR